jgi:hypothetical protein
MAKNINWWLEDSVEMTEIFCIHYHFIIGPTGSDPLLMACKSKAVLVKMAAHLLTLNIF